VLYSVVFLVILGFLNYIASQSRFTWRQDFTANQQFTLSPQTVQILEGLKIDIKATAFFSPQAFGRQDAEDRLKEYKLHSTHFNYEFVDPIDHPDIARQLGLSRDGGIVFQNGSKMQEATSTSESDFTSAILKVTSDTQPSVLFITGYKERDPNGLDDQGFGNIRQWLEKDNYTVSTLNLVITNTIPTSATVLVLAGPQNPLTDNEQKTLSAYLNQGGRLLVLNDPSVSSTVNPVGALLDNWGVKFDNDEVVDPVQYAQSPLLPAVAQYQLSTITQKMNGLVTVFPFARSLSRAENAPPSLSVTSFAQSTAQAWGETTLDPNIPAKYDEGKDIKGPVNLAMSVEGTAPISSTNPVSDTTSTRKTRIVVFGTSELVSNRILNAQELRGVANIDLFVNSVNWLAEEENLISIRPVPPDQRSLVMTGPDQQKVFFLSVIALPALVLFTGLSVWWRRR
jgi:ABC-type uncharacterized transport system involved in gliding motility auxiliary subunit